MERPRGWGAPVVGSRAWPTEGRSSSKVASGIVAGVLFGGGGGGGSGRAGAVAGIGAVVPVPGVSTSLSPVGVEVFVSALSLFSGPRCLDTDSLMMELVVLQSLTVGGAVASCRRLPSNPPPPPPLLVVVAEAKVTSTAKPEVRIVDCWF